LLISSRFEASSDGGGWGVERGEGVWFLPISTTVTSKFISYIRLAISEVKIQYF
jgi:hypothetical protein